MKLLAAAGRLSLAASTLAAERLALAAFGRQSRRPLPAVLGDAAEAASAELGEMSEVLHNAGGELAGSVREWTADLVHEDPGRLSRAARSTQEVLSLLRPDDDGDCARQEARSKLDVFWQVRRARSAHGMRLDGRPFDLEPALERALEHDDEFRFWALEGLGHDYAKGFFESGLTPRALLRHPALEQLDTGDLAALHAGLGLATADFVAGGLHRRAGDGRFHAATSRFAEVCLNNAASEAQAQMALEALGLVVSVFRSPLRQGFEMALGSKPRLRRLYWHGAGRGFYFGGSQLLPGYGSFSRAVLNTTERAPDVSCRLDAWAGLAYAFAMVNAKTPPVIAAALVKQAPALEKSADLRLGLGTGLAGARAMMRLSGRSSLAARLLDETESLMPRRLWRQMMLEPDERLRRQGPEHDLYGALPWGGG